MAWSPLGGAGADAFPAGLRGPLEAMARERGLSPETLAVAWLLRHPAGIVPVVGTTRPERIRELAGADAVELGRAEWYALLEAALGRRLP
jgi:predicted oxidoreductase